MSLNSLQAFGLREIKITDDSGAGAIALPVASQLHIEEDIVTEEFYGEGLLKAQVAIPMTLMWTIQSGSLPLEALALMTGRSASYSGTTPNQILSLSGGLGDTFPYFRIYGKIVGDLGDDVHVKIYHAKVTSLQGTYRDSQFFILQCRGVAIGDSSHGFYELVQHETTVSL